MNGVILYEAVDCFVNQQNCLPSCRLLRFVCVARVCLRSVFVNLNLNRRDNHRLNSLIGFENKWILIQFGGELLLCAYTCVCVRVWLERLSSESWKKYREKKSFCSRSYQISMLAKIC